MKFRSSYLFYILFLVSIGLLFTNNSSTSLAMHDTYFVIDFHYYFIVVSSLLLLTALTYSTLDKLKKPISTKTGIVHFILTLLGLILSLNMYRLVMTFVILGGLPDTISFATDPNLFITLLGPLLLFAGLTLFVIAIIKALRNKKNAY